MRLVVLSTLTELGMPKVGTRPTEGLMLKTPLNNAAGMETDPPGKL
jgi:hypothetical protein